MSDLGSTSKGNFRIIRTPIMLYRCEGCDTACELEFSNDENSKESSESYSLECSRVFEGKDPCEMVEGEIFEIAAIVSKP